MDDYNAIQNSLYNIFTTMRGKRRFLNEFASILYDELFEQITVNRAEEIRQILYSMLYRWEDRIQILGLYVTPYPDKSSYIIELIYSIKSDINQSIYNFKYILGSK